MKVWRKALHCEGWRPWFAWHPVKAEDSLVWLQGIERRRCYAVIDESWECRLPLLREAGREIGVPGMGSERRAAFAVGAGYTAGYTCEAGGWDGATGKFEFRQKLWGKIVLQVEEEVKPFLPSKGGALERRWRDAALMDLTSPEMRDLIDLQFQAPPLRCRHRIGGRLCPQWAARG